MLLRLANWFYRFLLSSSIVGFINSFKMLVVFHFTDKIRNIEFKGKRFYFRGKKDGVISHFYNLGYYIKENGVQIKTIIDGGANIGSETFRFRIHYPNAKIIAIEASSDNFKILEKNFSSDPNTILINKAIWKSSGKIYLYDGGGSQSFYVNEHENEGKLVGKIEAVGLNDIMKNQTIDEVDVLKLDVEGAEKEIFSENIEWLSKVNCLIFEVPDSDAPFTTQQIYQQINSLGLKYRSYVCSECLVLIKDGLPWEMKKVNGFYL
jgi:FkbM family methyltransferase